MPHLSLLCSSLFRQWFLPWDFPIHLIWQSWFPMTLNGRVCLSWSLHSNPFLSEPHSCRPGLICTGHFTWNLNGEVSLAYILLLGIKGAQPHFYPLRTHRDRWLLRTWWRWRYWMAASGSLPGYMDCDTEGGQCFVSGTVWGFCSNPPPPPAATAPHPWSKAH